MEMDQLTHGVRKENDMFKLKKGIAVSIFTLFMFTVFISLIGKNVFATDVNIDKDVLSVKCQTSIKSNGTSNDISDDTANLRMVSSLDSLIYKRVGFEVYILNDAGDAVDKKFDKVMKEVFPKIETETKGLEYTFSPQIFDVASNYFITYTLTGIPYEYFDNGILIKPFVIAKGDASNTRVYGTSRYTTINDMKAGDSLYLAVENETLEKDVTWTIKAGETSYTNSEQIDVNIASGEYPVSDENYTHVKVTGTDFKATSLPSVTTFVVSDGTNEVSMLHRDLYYTPNADGSITPDTTWYTDAKGPYVIVTAADLYGLAEKSASITFANQAIYLANDIAVNSTDVMSSEGYAGAVGWTPIGTGSKPFNGKFFGQGHTISGLYYNDPTGTYIGLFGVTNTSCQIQDIHLKESYFSAKKQLGSIAGRGNGTFSNIYSNATVVSTEGISGGLIGDVKHTTESKVSGCWFDGDVIVNYTSSGNLSGGIVGSVYSSGKLTISNCLNTGNVTASRASAANFTGGIIGSQQDTSTLYIEHCLVSGVVSNSANNQGLNAVLGGTNGSTGTVEITDVYTTQDFGRIHLKSEVDFKYTINNQEASFDTNGYVCSEVTPVISAEDITDDTATTQSTLSGFDFTKEWTAKDGYYPVPTGLADLAGLYPTVDYKLIYNFELMNNFKGDYASQDGGYDAVWGKYISQLTDTDVDMITLTPGIYRTNLWPSEVDTHWTEYAPTQAETDFAIYERAKAYMLAGGDPFQEMIDYCDEYGYEVFVNYRMNDQHYTSDSTFATHNQFYLECLDKEGFILNADSETDNHTLNYAKEEVRDYYYGILEELCTNYDVDGLELDFERAPIFFDAETLAADTDGDGVNDGTEIMTDFVKSVREMLDSVGEEKDKYLPLSVRVCDSLEESSSVGLDVATWVDEGYVDIVNATSSYFQSLSVDVESYKNAIGDSAKVYAELHYVTDQSTEDKYQRVYTTAEGLKATAESYYARGVDGISAFNMDYSENMTKTLSGLKGITDAEILKNSEKHYVMRSGYGFYTANGDAAVTTVMPVDNTLFGSALLRVETVADSTETELEVYFNDTKLETAESTILTDKTELFPRLADSDAYATAERLKYYIIPLNIIQNGENKIETRYVSGTECVIRVIEAAVYHEDSYALQGLEEVGESNLLANGGFGRSGESWTAVNKIGTLEWLIDGGVDNSNCLVYNITSGSSGTAQIGDLQLYQSLKGKTVSAGRVYRFTFKAKLVGAESMELGKIWIRNNEATAVELGAQTNIQISGSEWTEYTVDIPVTTDCTGIRMLLQMGGNVIVPEGETVQLYLDHLCLVDYGTPSVLSNGELESKTSWSSTIDTSKEAAGTASWLTSGGVDNSGCLCFEITDAGNAVNAIQLLQNVTSLTVTEGETYNLTFQAKVEGAESWNIGQIWLRNSGTEYIELTGMSSETISGAEWTEYSITMEVKKTNTGVRLLFQMGNGFTVPNDTTVKLYFDNIELKKQ